MTTDPLVVLRNITHMIKICVGREQMLNYLSEFPWDDSNRKDETVDLSNKLWLPDEQSMRQEIIKRIVKADDTGAACVDVLATVVIEYFRPYLCVQKQESGEHAKTIDLVNMIRMKLERRFQVADYLVDGFEDPPARSVVTDICQDIMTHVREIHSLAERALNSIEDGSQK